MKFPFSRVMRASDYELFPECGQTVDDVQALAGPVHPHQHPHRRWEYMMMVAAFNFWLSRKERSDTYNVGDFGCGIGLSPAIMLYLNNDVTMYEPWTFGNEDEFQLRQMNNIGQYMAKVQDRSAMYAMIHRALGELMPEADHNRYDVALCISTIEHIKNYLTAFEDMCRTVKPGGMMFLTMDFCTDPVDHYQHAPLRGGVMPTARYMETLQNVAWNFGFRLLGEESSWDWDESCRLVHDYGFASLALEKTS